METKETRLPVLPYVLIVLLIGFSLLLDGALARAGASTSETANIWPRVLVWLDSKLVFALLAALFICAVIRAGLSLTGAWILIAVGAVLLLGPVLVYAGWIRAADSSFILLGENLLSSAALILAGGLLALLSRKIVQSPAG